MRAALLATLPLAVIACSHAAPAPAAAQAAASAAPDAGVGLSYPVARKVDVVDDYHGTKVGRSVPLARGPLQPGLPGVDRRREHGHRALPLDSSRPWATPRAPDRAVGQRALRGSRSRGQPRSFTSATRGLQHSAGPVRRRPADGSSRARCSIRTRSSKDGTVAVTGHRALARRQPARLRPRGGRQRLAGVAGPDVDTGAGSGATGSQWVKFSAAELDPRRTGFYYCALRRAGAAQLRDVNYFQKLYYHRLGTPQSADRLDLRAPRPEGMGLRPHGLRRRPLAGHHGLPGHRAEEPGLPPRLESEGLGWSDRWSTSSRRSTPSSTATGRCSGSSPTSTLRADGSSPSTCAATDRAPGRRSCPRPAPGSRARRSVSQRFVLNYLEDAHSTIEIYELDGKLEQRVKIPVLGTAERLRRTPRPGRDLLLLRDLRHAARDLPARRRPPGTSASSGPPKVKFEPGEFESQQVFYHEQGRHAGPDVPHLPQGDRSSTARNPTLLYGYGGFNISDDADASRPAWLAWLEHGRRVRAWPTCAAAASTARRGTRRA